MRAVMPARGRRADLDGRRAVTVAVVVAGALLLAGPALAVLLATAGEAASAVPVLAAAFVAAGIAAAAGVRVSRRRRSR
jgi:hypothetical protein